MHNLKLEEAIRRTEIAIRDALVAGDSRLRVICGLGSRSERRERELPHLRLALTKAMSECVAFCFLMSRTWLLADYLTLSRQRIESEVDPDNPGVLNIRLPFA